MNENVPKSTIYDIINRAENGSGYKRVSGSGRTPRKMNAFNLKQLKRMFDNRDGVSQKEAGLKFNCTQQYISWTLKNNSAIRCFKKKKIPLRTIDQIARIRPRCRRLYKILLSNSCIMDDESYFTLAHNSLGGSGHFYSSNRRRAPASVRFQGRPKYQKKLLVWMVFSERDIGKLCFAPSGPAINQKTYLRDCIQRRLLQFIKKYNFDCK